MDGDIGERNNRGRMERHWKNKGKKRFGRDKVGRERQCGLGKGRERKGKNKGKGKKKWEFGQSDRSPHTTMTKRWR